MKWFSTPKCRSCGKFCDGSKAHWFRTYDALGYPEDDCCYCEKCDKKEAQQRTDKSMGGAEVKVEYLSQAFILTAKAMPHETFAVLCAEDEKTVRKRWQKKYGDIPKNIKFVKQISTGFDGELIAEGELHGQ